MILPLLAILVGVGVVLRLLSPLPSLQGRSTSQALGDTADTPLGQAIAEQEDCQDFRVRAGIMGEKECHYVPTQGAGDPG